MGYLDEAGLAALVGKVKGQMVELTAEEYAQIDPAIKNYDNKLYFVKDDVTGYQIDEEPTANSDGLVKSGGIYNWTSKIGSGSLATTAQTLIPAVNEVNAKIGSTDISSIGDGTVTGAVNALNTGLNQLIRTESFTATTSSGGNISHDFDGDVFVLGASCNKSDTFIVPFVSINSGTPYFSRWWFNARNAGTSGSAVTGTSMTITVTYIVMN